MSESQYNLSQSPEQVIKDLLCMKSKDVKDYYVSAYINAPTENAKSRVMAEVRSII